MHSVDNELIRHASQSIEDNVPEQAPLDIPIIEVVQKDFHYVIEKVPRLSVVDRKHQLCVCAVEPHDEANPNDQVQIVPTEHGIQRWTNHDIFHVCVLFDRSLHRV